MPLFMKRRTLKISVDLIPQSPDPDSGTLRSLKKERTSSRARILLLFFRRRGRSRGDRCEVSGANTTSRE
jgi:hypothetical protein